MYNLPAFYELTKIRHSGCAHAPRRTDFNMKTGT